MPTRLFAAIFLGILVLTACVAPEAPGAPAAIAPVENQPAVEFAPQPTASLATDAQPADEDEAMTFELSSPAFAQGDPIPEKYTCKGDDVSPPLTWSSPPAGTQSLALIMDDPDAPVGTWVHWVLFNIPAEQRILEEDAPGAISAGINSWKRAAYGGPCPPLGTHRYFFKL